MKHRDGRARCVKGRRADHVVGFASVECAGCDSEVTYATTERPAACPLCGTPLPVDDSAVRVADIAGASRKGGTPAFIAGRLGRMVEHKNRRNE